MGIILQTNRTTLKKLTERDHCFLVEILQEPNLMLSGWGKIFTDEEVQQWFRKIQQQYQHVGYSYFLSEKEGRKIGLVGLLPAIILGSEVTEIAYIVKKEFQQQGLAFEMVTGLLNFAFQQEKVQEVVAQINPKNQASRRLVERLHMLKVRKYSRKQNGKEQIHWLYKLNKQKFTETTNKSKSWE